MPNPITFNTPALYNKLDHQRQQRNLSWYVVARQTGIRAGTFVRIAQGNDLSIHSLARIMAWLEETDITPYTTTPS